MLSWFEEEGAEIGLSVCRVKNKFSQSASVADGYRDLSLSVIFFDASGLKIIGEVQIHDHAMHELKLQVICCQNKGATQLWLLMIAFTGMQMHALYKIKRAADPDSVLSQ